MRLVPVVIVALALALSWWAFLDYRFGLAAHLPGHGLAPVLMHWLVITSSLAIVSFQLLSLYAVAGLKAWGKPPWWLFSAILILTLMVFYVISAYGHLQLVNEYLKRQSHGSTVLPILASWPLFVPLISSIAWLLILIPYGRYEHPAWRQTPIGQSIVRLQAMFAQAASWSTTNSEGDITLVNTGERYQAQWHQQTQSGRESFSNEFTSLSALSRFLADNVVVDLERMQADAKSTSVSSA